MNEIVKEIEEKIMEFCSKKPLKGFELQYLSKASELYELFYEFIKVMEQEDLTKLNEISAKIDEIL